MPGKSQNSSLVACELDVRAAFARFDAAGTGAIDGDALEAALCALLDTLHEAPPSGGGVQPASKHSLMLTALGAQAYHATWRLLDALKKIWI